MPNFRGVRREVYSGRVRLNGEEHEQSLVAANNYVDSLRHLKRFKEAKTLLHDLMPVVRRVLGKDHLITLKMRWLYAMALYHADAATLDDLREAVKALEETVRTARRVLGGAHPLTFDIEFDLKHARAALGARETPPPGRA